MRNTTTARPRGPIPMSWDDYEALGPNVEGEYIDGELVMAPASTQPHQKICRRLANIIEEALPAGVDAIKGRSCGR